MNTKNKTEKQSHTPGPWNWRGHICTGIEGPDSQVVADVGLACGAISKSEAQANARLIAAAPDLLAALKSALVALETHEKIEGREEMSFHPAIEKANAAILRATEGK